jgi:6-phosphogluconolactonase
MAIIQTFKNSQLLAESAALHFIDCAQEAIKDHGFFAVVLAGGSTPKATYEKLATLEYTSSVDWDKVHVFWGDERCVGPEHEDSNYRMAFNVMLRHSPISVKQIYRIQGELEPQNAAKAYENQLQTFFGGKVPRFDLILLGLGDDGHTASLFPDTKALQEKKRWVIENYVKKLSTWRLTMTVNLINQAANVTFLVSGKDKSNIVRRVLAGRYTPEELPAQMIRPEKGQLRWLMDHEAAVFL